MTDTRGLLFKAADGIRKREEGASALEKGLTESYFSDLKISFQIMLFQKTAHGK